MPLAYLELDPAVNGIVNQLKKQYPNQKSEPIFLGPVADRLKNIEEDRLTLVGHSHGEKFANYTPVDLADKLINEMGLDLNKVKTIDLIGCEAGFFKEGSNFSINFAAELARRGYSDVTVKSLTNIGYGKDLSEMIVSRKNKDDKDIAYFEIMGLPTDKVNEVTQLREKKDKIQNVINNLSLMSQLSSVTIQSISKELEPIRHFIGADQLKNFNNSEDPKQYIKQVRSELKRSTNFLEIQEKQHWEVLYSTTDVRTTLDSSQNRNFNAGKALEYVNKFEEVKSMKNDPAKYSRAEIARGEREMTLIKQQISPSLTNERLINITIQAIDTRIKQLRVEESNKIFGSSENSMQAIKIRKLEEVKEKIREGKGDLSEILKEALLDKPLVKGYLHHHTKHMLTDLLSMVNETRKEEHVIDLHKEQDFKGRVQILLKSLPNKIFDNDKTENHFKIIDFRQKIQTLDSQKYDEMKNGKLEEIDKAIKDAEIKEAPTNRMAIKH